MTKMMKGYAMLRIGATGWIEKPVPVCGPMDAVLRPLVVAPCTTDIKTVWQGALGERTNMILGHECCAEVTEVGTLVKDFRPGDKVVVPAVTPNWSSLAAQAGQSSHSDGLLNGWKYSNSADGVFSEYFICNDADGNLAHLPNGVSAEEATMLADMVAPGFQSVEFADVQFGDTVLVIGIGPVGLMAVAASALRGAGKIIAVGSRPRCVAAAKGYGATHVINYKDGPIEDQVFALTGGKGVDRVCVCGGTGEVFVSAVRSVKPGGKIGSVISLAMSDKLVVPSLDWGFGMGNKQIVGGAMVGGRLRMEKLGVLLETGRLNVKPLITHRFYGWDQLEEAIFLAREKPVDLIKSVITVG
ncbi:NAD(P)-dependent alcohol dehydrogenase [Pseudotabrizicola sp. 4114]|uniref:NAD(P)-dependent alcohol dehydrogenase n=1 Tax=Pseudotabrizicola sp. 4114 TaxID=2817731 RepID=UPI00285DA447|nr:threonine dehydrogenase-like Zn-dependent dehydrogenase [Pseudorhodobacter sp. 4114]